MAEEQKTGQALEAQLKVAEATQAQTPDITIKEENLPPAPEQITVDEADLPPAPEQITVDEADLPPAPQPDLVIADEDLAQAPRTEVAQTPQRPNRLRQILNRLSGDQ